MVGKETKWLGRKKHNWIFLIILLASYQLLAYVVGSSTSYLAVRAIESTCCLRLPLSSWLSWVLTLFPRTVRKACSFANPLELLLSLDAAEVFYFWKNIKRFKVLLTLEWFFTEWRPVIWYNCDEQTNVVNEKMLYISWQDVSKWDCAGLNALEAPSLTVKYQPVAR